MSSKHALIQNIRVECLNHKTRSKIIFSYLPITLVSFISIWQCATHFSEQTVDSRSNIVLKYKSLNNIITIYRKEHLQKSK